jgi:hypothetical protein
MEDALGGAEEGGAAVIRFVIPTLEPDIPLFVWVYVVEPTWAEHLAVLTPAVLPQPRKDGADSDAVYIVALIEACTAAAEYLQALEVAETHAYDVTGGNVMAAEAICDKLCAALALAEKSQQAKPGFDWRGYKLDQLSRPDEESR